MLVYTNPEIAMALPSSPICGLWLLWFWSSWSS